MVYPEKRGEERLSLSELLQRRAALRVVEQKNEASAHPCPASAGSDPTDTVFGSIEHEGGGIFVMTESYPQSDEQFVEEFDLYVTWLIRYVRRPGQESQDIRDLKQTFYLYFVNNQILKRFDPSAGTKFSTYLYHVIRNFFSRETRNRFRLQDPNGISLFQLEVLEEELEPGPYDAGRCMSAEAYSLRERLVRDCPFLDVERTVDLKRVSEFLENLDFTGQTYVDEESGVEARRTPALVFQLCRVGYTLSEIGKMLDCSKTNASFLRKRAVEEARGFLA